MRINRAEAWLGLDSALTGTQPEFLSALERMFLHIVRAFRLPLILLGGQ